MIVKKVIFKKHKSNFKALSEYILDVKNDGAKVLFEYMLDQNNGMEKVEAYNFSNCSFENQEDNIAEILNTQALNTTSKQDKTMHLVVSFQEDEHPSFEVMKSIEIELMKALGMEKHQRLSVVHSNTNNLHMHIAVNKVDPDTMKVKNPYNDVKILQETAIKLEMKFGLKIDNHISSNDKGQNKYNKHTMSCDFETWVKTKLNAEVSMLLAANKTTFQDLRKCLAKYDLEFRERRKGFVISSKSEKLFCKASSVHRELSKQALEKRFGNLNLKPTFEIEEKQPAKSKFNKFEGMPTHPLYEKYKEADEQRRKKLKLGLDFIELRRNELNKLVKSSNFDKKTIIYSKTQRALLKNKVGKLYKEYKKRSFRDFLLDEALSGNQEAIRMLRITKPKFDLSENTLSSKTDKAQIFQDADFISKEGYIVYKGNGKSKIIDKGQFIKISMLEDDRELLLKSLLVSMERFGKNLNITGNDKFKKDVLDIVNEYSLNVVFKDQSMQSINIANQNQKTEQQARLKIKEAVDLKIKILKQDKKVKDIDRQRGIKNLEKFRKKLSKTRANIFAGDFKRLGVSADIADQMNTIPVKIQVDGFLVNNKNFDGLLAMNTEIEKRLEQSNNIKELERFRKFLYVFNKDGKVEDIAKGFYENRNVDVDQYIKEYGMEESKLDKQANAIDLGNSKNYDIVNKIVAEIQKGYTKELKDQIKINI
ncbi:TraI/MobA(P) family conjugative relaxase [uncultured Campylobacter sp.]|uniref:TraI/MobA(P) family conjugative relaxase n=1 Tax=uncultured Campylobacter sp. TaxID=218934 RepID=UPI00262C853B|nr:TraI/MobA(P) family conjugative relaxase [uncultured Campylobacter sp.]